MVKAPLIKYFRVGVILRVLLLTASLFLTVYLVFSTSYYVSQFIILIIVALQIYFLIRYLEKTNQLLIRFLEAIRYSDFTGTFRDHQSGSNFGELNEAFNKVIEKFKEERGKKEESIRYLETVVQHIGVGLFCFNSKGEIVLLNTAAKRLFGVAVLRNIGGLKTISKSLFDTVQKLKNGNRSLLRATINNETLQLAIYVTEFRMRDEAFKLVSLQNIHTELEEKEMEAWQNLTQVLAHEIMNSITPIASLSATVHMLLEKNTVIKEEHAEINTETVHDAKQALNTIGNRSQGLMRFVNSYRDFTQIPELNYELFYVREILVRVSNLMKPEAAKNNVSVEIESDPQSLELTADPHLVEQVLINLVKNAIGALTNQKEASIKLKGGIDSSGSVIMQVQDNGPGVKPSDTEKIFIPFYSIGQGRGSGIGLSLSREIMRMHGGSLTLRSEPGKGSVFTIRF
ncbi:MAG: ATP-binding protein [Balneolaceae bacterium]